MKLGAIKQAAEDILVRPPDLDKKKAPAVPEPEDNTSKAEKAKSDVGGDTPESGVTDKSANVAWSDLDAVSRSYLLGFIDQCKQANVSAVDLGVPESLVTEALASLTAQ